MRVALKNNLKKPMKLFSSILALFLLGGCSSAISEMSNSNSTPEQQEYENFSSLSSEVFQNLVETDEYTVIDIRTPQEITQGKIFTNAKEIDFYADDFQNRLQALPKEEKYILYCRSGNRTGQALTTMKKLGFQEAYDLKGGITKWQKDGKAINQEVSDPSSLQSELRAEFEGAYKKEAEPNGDIVEREIEASESEVEIIDGIKTKVWSYNGQVPAPEIRLTLGQTLKINFTNTLPQETTIHFHGIRVPNAMDGVPGVTQDPIQPGETFVYEFTPKDAGTYWYHPHVRSAEQMERGLFGTIIVEDMKDPGFSQDVVWVVDDWLLQRDGQVYNAFVTMHDVMHEGRWGNVVTVNGKTNTVLEARPGERIRLRLVNTSNARVYAPNFADLKADVFAVDGMYSKRTLLADGFEIAPGNRIDIDIQIPADAEGDYHINDTFTRNTIPLGTIRVSGEAVASPVITLPQNSNLPDWTAAKDFPVTKEYRLNIQRTGGGRGMGMMGGLEWTINGKAYPDYEPFSLELDQFQKLRFTNESTRIHPMHLHGQFFKVLARNGIPVDEPYFRDTVLVHANETVDVGLVPLDKGEWMNHCHILEHADAGMMTITTVQ
jgi:FtsP/CotA-like multicopper oxidase with cupredoxin domain/rhodanese-related sulfurtransferase